MPAPVHDQLLGKPFVFRVVIKGAEGLAVNVDKLYCEYAVNGTTHATDLVEKGTEEGQFSDGRAPTLNYEMVHEVPSIDESMARWLTSKEPVILRVYGEPEVLNAPADRISTGNRAVVQNILTTFGIKSQNAIVAAALQGGDDPLQRENERLRGENQRLRQERERLVAKLKELGVDANELGLSTPRERLAEARARAETLALEG